MTTRNQHAYEALADALRTSTLFQTTEFQRPNVQAHWGPNVQESIASFMDNGMQQFAAEHGQKIADDYVKGLQLLQGVDEVVAVAKDKHRQSMKNVQRNFVRMYFADRDDVELSLVGLNVTVSDIDIVHLGGLHNPHNTNQVVYNTERDILEGTLIFRDSLGTFWFGDLSVDAGGTWNVKLHSQLDPRHPLITGNGEDIPW